MTPDTLREIQIAIAQLMPNVKKVRLYLRDGQGRIDLNIPQVVEGKEGKKESGKKNSREQQPPGQCSKRPSEDNQA